MSDTMTRKRLARAPQKRRGVAAPDIYRLPTDEAVAYLVENFGTDYHDAMRHVLIEKGEYEHDIRQSVSAPRND